jgi:molecular chaperone DnaK
LRIRGWFSNQKKGATMSESNPVPVGIDLGTTFSAIAWVNEALGKAEIIPNKESERITPSVVMFEDESIVVGRIAKEAAVAEPGRIVEFVKREMGKATGALFGEYAFEFNGKPHSAETISAFILKKLKNDAEEHLGCPVKDAVITVPAYFNDAERNATKNAGQIAGLNILGIINEPVAAAMAYGLDKLGKDQTVFVFDLGGGTFDVTVIQLKGHEFNMLATNGDHRLGGKDWDDRLVLYIAECFQNEHGLDPLDDLQASQDLQNRATQAKITLSQRPKARIACSYAGKTLSLEITREKFEELTTDLVGKCRALSEFVLHEVGLTWSEMDTVLLTGGSTRMPMIKNMLRQLTGKIPSEEVNPDECVALGAAYHAAMLRLAGEHPANPKLERLQQVQVNLINSHTLSTALWNPEIQARYKHPMIPKMSPIPFQISQTFYTVEDNQTGVRTVVYEGEAEALEDCIPIGECRLEGLPARPKGQPIEVTFNYDTNGMLEVHSKDVQTGQERRTVLDRATGLTEAAVREETQYVQSIQVE